MICKFYNMLLPLFGSNIIAHTTACNRALADGIVNELLKAIPLEYQQTIHKLLIIMWATGITPKDWKASESILIYKEKGPATDLASYRP
jgi:hypothetical protein